MENINEKSTKGKTLNIGRVSIQVVEKGEKDSTTSQKKISSFDWKEFWHMLVIWFLSGVIILLVLIALTMAEGSTNLWVDVVARIDTLSLMFSLVLSALLEQMWNAIENVAYNFTKIIGVILAVAGLVMYLLFSILQLHDDANPYLQEMFGINLGYIIVSVLFVICSFATRANVNQEVRGNV